MGKIKGTHSSPGIYTKITDLSYSVAEDGATVLGVVGETLKGPAFEPTPVGSFDEYKTYFGGTSAEIFKDSQYPKYELPYIAKSYLSVPSKLYVCRVLGLSGYNAGPAFIIKAKSTSDTKEYVVAVLRARGNYKKYANVGTDCNPISKYDTLDFVCDEITLEPYVNLSVQYKCDELISATTQESVFNINTLNHGQFTIVAKKGGEEVGRYPVSLNAGAKDYIYNVIGCNPTNGSAAVFIEELYDVMLNELISTSKVNTIVNTVTTIKELQIQAVTEPVADLVNIPAYALKNKYLGQTFIYDGKEIDGTSASTIYYLTDESGVTSNTPTAMKEGYIYYVKVRVNESGKKEYFYTNMSGSTIVNGVKVIENEAHVEKVVSATTSTDVVNAVKVLSYDAFVYLGENGHLTLSNDMSDYHEQFRCAITPWIVSELKGSGKNNNGHTITEVKKLFRFYTITDGNAANQAVKISITNIKPDDGTFDVLVRDYNDSDGNMTILESFRNLTMVPGDSKYIGLQIGTLDGAYLTKSKYVLVEIIENEMTRNCVPAGFLGYPTRNYPNMVNPYFTFNQYYDENIKDKRQFFGLSDITGVDVDMLNYKGKNAYTENYVSGYTHSFHLDARLSETIKTLTSGVTTVDGDENTKGIIWDAVSPNNKLKISDSYPVIASEEEMSETIYSNIKLRKFTVYPYGGFDGWDIYRKSRTNTDEFKANKYKGTISNGNGQTFSKINDGSALALSGNCITSDYYAYLAGINQFENPEKIEINLFATPGIDYVNNELLVNDALDMIDERLDTLYIPTTPDKPWGASDAIENMFTSSDVVSNLEDTDINTYYAATYYPWVTYFDEDNNVYINLPVTKDIVRNMADVDNKRFPWIAPAGLERGTVECAKMHFPAKLEDRDIVYDGRINAVTKFSKDGVKIWGNKTLYQCDDTNPMNRINTVRLMLYMRKVIIQSTLGLLFEPNDKTLADEFRSIVTPILSQIKSDRGISWYDLKVSQTAEQMDLHELSGILYVKPIGALENIEIEFVVSPQGVQFIM